MPEYGLLTLATARAPTATATKDVVPPPDIKP